MQLRQTGACGKIQSAAAGRAGDDLSDASAIAKTRRRPRTTAHRLLLRVLNRIRSSPSPLLTVTLLLVSLILVIGLAAYIIFWIYHHYQCYAREAGVVWLEGPSHTTMRKRPCPPPPYATILSSENLTSSVIPSSSICITSLTDSKSPSFWQRWIRCRDFDALRNIAFPTFDRYANKHGYRFFDSSNLIETSRPPAWSKILAVQRLLTEEDCQWVLWLDADIVIMNSDIRLESLLPALSRSDETLSIDLIATFDRKFTVNSGAWFLRNSAWSRTFLQQWYDHRSWVRRPGLSLSGDNAAFGHHVDKLLKHPTHRLHIARPGRCNFNSFGVFLTHQQLNDARREGFQNQPWYQSENWYHKGDFIVHASGIDQKAQVLQTMAKRAT